MPKQSKLDAYFCQNSFGGHLKQKDDSLNKNLVNQSVITFQEFKEFTNVNELLAENIKQKRPERYHKEQKNLDVYIEQVYKKFIEDPNCQKKKFFKDIKFFPKPWLTKAELVLLRQLNIKRCFVNMRQNNFVHDFNTVLIKKSDRLRGIELREKTKINSGFYLEKMISETVSKVGSLDKAIDYIKQRYINKHKKRLSEDVSGKSKSTIHKKRKIHYESPLSNKKCAPPSENQSYAVSVNKPCPLSKKMYSSNIKKPCSPVSINKPCPLSKKKYFSKIEEPSSPDLNNKPCPLSKKKYSSSIIRPGSPVSNSNPCPLSKKKCALNITKSCSLVPKNKPCSSSKKTSELRSNDTHINKISSDEKRCKSTEVVIIDSSDSSTSEVGVANIRVRLKSELKNLSENGNLSRRIYQNSPLAENERSSYSSCSPTESFPTVINARIRQLISNVNGEKNNKRVLYCEKAVDFNDLDSVEISNQNNFLRIIASRYPYLSAEDKQIVLKKYIKEVILNFDKKPANRVKENGPKTWDCKLSPKISEQLPQSENKNRTLYHNNLLPSPKLLTFSNFIKYTNVVDHLQADIMRRFPKDYKRYLKQFPKFIKNFYENIFLAKNEWPPGLKFKAEVLKEFQTANKHQVRNNNSNNITSEHAICQNIGTSNGTPQNKKPDHPDESRRELLREGLPENELYVHEEINQPLPMEAISLSESLSEKGNIKCAKELASIKTSTSERCFKKSCPNEDTIESEENLLCIAEKIHRIPNSEENRYQVLSDNLEKSQPLSDIESRRENPPTSIKISSKANSSPLETEIVNKGTERIEDTASRNREELNQRRGNKHKLLPNSRKSRNLIVLDRVHPRSLTFDEFKEHTNIEEYIRKDILKKFPETYKKYLPKMQKFIKKFYKKFFINFPTFPEGLVYISIRQQNRIVTRVNTENTELKENDYNVEDNDETMIISSENLDRDNINADQKHANKNLDNANVGSDNANTNPDNANLNPVNVNLDTCDNNVTILRPLKPSQDLFKSSDKSKIDEILYVSCHGCESQKELSTTDPLNISELFKKIEKIIPLNNDVFLCEDFKEESIDITENINKNKSVAKPSNTEQSVNNNIIAVKHEDISIKQEYSPISLSYKEDVEFILLDTPSPIVIEDRLEDAEDYLAEMVFNSQDQSQYHDEVNVAAQSQSSNLDIGTSTNSKKQNDETELGTFEKENPVESVSSKNLTLEINRENNTHINIQVEGRAKENGQTTELINSLTPWSASNMCENATDDMVCDKKEINFQIKKEHCNRSDANIFSFHSEMITCVHTLENGLAETFQQNNAQKILNESISNEQNESLSILGRINPAKISKNLSLGKICTDTLSKNVSEAKINNHNCTENETVNNCCKEFLRQPLNVVSIENMLVKQVESASEVENEQNQIVSLEKQDHVSSDKLYDKVNPVSSIDKTNAVKESTDVDTNTQTTMKSQILEKTIQNESNSIGNKNLENNETNKPSVELAPKKRAKLLGESEVPLKRRKVEQQLKKNEKVANSGRPDDVLSNKDFVPQVKHKFGPLALIQKKIDLVATADNDPVQPSTNIEKNSVHSSTDDPDYRIDDASQISVSQFLNSDNTYFTGSQLGTEERISITDKVLIISNIASPAKISSESTSKSSSAISPKSNKELPDSTKNGIIALLQPVRPSTQFGCITYLAISKIILNSKINRVCYDSSVPFLQPFEKQPLQATVNFKNNGFNQLNICGSSVRLLLGFTVKEWSCVLKILKIIDTFKYRPGDPEPTNESLPYRILYYLFKTLPKFAQVNFEYEDPNMNYVKCVTINTTYYKPISCLTKAIDTDILDQIRKMKQSLC